MQWKPIESAPKDGRKFLAITEAGKYRIDYFRSHEQGIWNCLSMFWEERPGDRYTHWMHLPSPPSET